MVCLIFYRENMGTEVILGGQEYGDPQEDQGRMEGSARTEEMATK